MVWIFYPLLTVSFSCRFPPVLSPVSSYLLSIPTTLVYAITPEHNRFSPYSLSVFFSLSFYSLLGFLVPFFNYTPFFHIFFSLFFLPFFSCVYSRNTYNSSIQPFILGPGGIW